MPGFKFKTIVVTLATAGTPVAASTGYLHAGTMVQPATGNTGTVFMGAAGVTSGTGYLITSTTPIKLSELITEDEFYGPSIFFVGSQNGDKVVLLVPVRDESAV